MHVLTLNETDFAEHCRRLDALARSFNADLVVTIATGGDKVGSYILPEIPHISISSHRPSTETKKRHARMLACVRRLPLPVRNIMRKAEATIVEHRINNATPHKINLDSETTARIAPAQRLLIVDDAVDSGATLAGVIDAISALDGKREIASAVLTVTTRNPLIRPTYALFDNRTLIRFPWSLDMPRKTNSND